MMMSNERLNKLEALAETDKFWCDLSDVADVIRELMTALREAHARVRALEEAGEEMRTELQAVAEGWDVDSTIALLRVEQWNRAVKEGREHKS